MICQRIWLNRDIGGRVTGALWTNTLFLVAILAVAIWRATKKVLVARIVLILGTAVTILALAGVSSLVSLAVALLGVLLILIIEQPRSAFSF